MFVKNVALRQVLLEDYLHISNLDITTKNTMIDGQKKKAMINVKFVENQPNIMVYVEDIYMAVLKNT